MHGLVANALSHVRGAAAHAPPAAALGRGLAAAVSAEHRDAFVSAFAGWCKLTPAAIFGSEAAARRGAMQGGAAPLPEGVVETTTLRAHLAALAPWLQAPQPVLLFGPQGSGKATLLRAAAAMGPSTAVAELACNAFTQSEDVVQKLLTVRALAGWLRINTDRHNQVS